MMRRLATLCLVLVSIAAINPVWSTEPKAAEEPVIPGITIERKDSKAMLGIQIVANSFKLSFYDEEKMPVKADFPRALLRWDVTYKKVQERLILTPGGDGTFLTSTRTIRPPYNFELFITPIAHDKDTESETYVIRFRQ